MRDRIAGPAARAGCRCVTAPLACAARHAYLRLRPAGSENRTKGMLTMRFLLTFHCEATGQWRCLDTALLAAFRSGRAEDLPAALRDEPDLVMRWLLGRYEIAKALIPATTGPAGQDGLIAVYALDPDRSVIGFENAYNGAWLEMFLLENRPIGHIGMCKVSAPSVAMVKLEERAARPLWTSDAACHQTVSRIIEHQEMLDKRRKTGAGRENAPVEKLKT